MLDELWILLQIDSSHEKKVHTDNCYGSFSHTKEKMVEFNCLKAAVALLSSRIKKNINNVTAVGDLSWKHILKSRWFEVGRGRGISF